MSEYDESFEICDDCGRRFPRSEMRRCKICGHFVCPECRGTHVTKYHKSAAKPETVPTTTTNEEPVESTPINRENEEQPRVVPPVYHASAREEVIACVDCGREFPVSRMKKCNICNGAVCSYCQPSHLSKKHGHFLYSDYVTPAAAPANASATSTVASATAFAAASVTEEPDTSIHFKENLDENPIGQASADYSYAAPVAEEPAATSTEIVDDDPGDGRIKCDDCGQYFQKEELRTCRKCGHHVCPSCRTHHKCPKPVKEPKEPKPPKQHKRRKHDELGDPVY